MLQRIKLHRNNRNFHKMIRAMRKLKEQYQRDLVDPAFSGHDDQVFLKYEIDHILVELERYGL